MKCVLIFSTNLTEKFFFFIRNDRDMMKMYIGLHIKYPFFLSDCNKNPSSDSWVVLCRQRDIKLIDVCRNFANAPKKDKERDDINKAWKRGQNKETQPTKFFWWSNRKMPLPCVRVPWSYRTHDIRGALRKTDNLSSFPNLSGGW